MRNVPRGTLAKTRPDVQCPSRARFSDFFSGLFSRGMRNVPRGTFVVSGKHTIFCTCWLTYCGNNINRPGNIIGYSGKCVIFSNVPRGSFSPEWRLKNRGQTKKWAVVSLKISGAEPRLRPPKPVSSWAEVRSPSERTGVEGPLFNQRFFVIQGALDSGGRRRSG
jgi:hypothetical protein